MPVVLSAAGAILAHSAQGGVASWWPLVGLLAGAAFVVGLALRRGRARDHGLPAAVLVRIGDGFERRTGVAGWAAVTVATSLFGLVVAGIGFYADVAWHVDLGRDKQLFTPPHTMIVLGLGLIAVAGALGIAIASLTRDRRAPRRGRLRAPSSTIALLVIGLTALVGFPLDELWHEAYGIDVTMWSPTHLLMIVGASISPLAAWLVLGEAGSRPSDGGWARLLHVACGWLTLAGLASAQGEFEFGVPQFQQLYHPILVMLAGGFALSAARVVLGAWWPFAVAAGAFLVRAGQNMGAASDGHITPRAGAIYVGTAVAIEVAARVAGERRGRFVALAAAGTATVGLAAEWAWNANAHQPWTPSLLPEGVVLPVIAAVAAVALGTAFGDAVTGRPVAVPVRGLALAGVAVVVLLALPLPRRGLDVAASIQVEPAEGGRVATVRMQLDPPDAADGARWVQATAWQGGGLVLAEMRDLGGGEYVSARPLPIGGSWKTLVRIHRGAAMVALPVWLPEDRELGLPETPATDRAARFEPEQRYLLREAEPAQGAFAAFAYLVVGFIAVLWASALVRACAAVVRWADRRPNLPPALSDARAVAASS